MLDGKTGFFRVIDSGAQEAQGGRRKWHLSRLGGWIQRQRMQRTADLLMWLMWAWFISAPRERDKQPHRKKRHQVAEKYEKRQRWRMSAGAVSRKEGEEEERVEDQKHWQQEIRIVLLTCGSSSDLWPLQSDSTWPFILPAPSPLSTPRGRKKDRETKRERESLFCLPTKYLLMKKYEKWSAALFSFFYCSSLISRLYLWLLDYFHSFKCWWN